MCCTGKDRKRNLTPRQKFQPDQPVAVEVGPKVAPHTAARRKYKKRVPKEIKTVKANEIFRELRSVQLEK